MDISISVEGQMGLTWPLWRRWVAMAEGSGFSELYRSDHFTMPSPPDRDSSEMVVSLTYQAEHSQRLLFSPLVAPLSFRDPTMLARQAAALDDLSSGRLVLGVEDLILQWFDLEAVNSAALFAEQVLARQ